MAGIMDNILQPLTTDFVDSSVIAQEERIVPLDGTYNLRDLGGYPTQDKRKVKWGMVYRSDELSHLTLRDQKILSEKNIHTIVDFRTLEEKKRSPHRLPESVKEVIECEIVPGNIIDLSKINEKNAVEVMINLTRSLVHEGQASYTRFFAALLSPDATPLLFNCAAGKDRTGLAAALFLSGLNVSHDIVLEDYLLSAGALKRKYDFLIKGQPWLEPLITVRQAYIDAAFEEINTHFGGVESFLIHELKVDLSALQAKFTE